MEQQQKINNNQQAPLFVQFQIDKLVEFLKLHCPVDTGTLRDFGIQSAQTGAGNWEIVLGVDSTFASGRNPAEYVYNTEYTNKSAGWIELAINDWLLWMQQIGGNYTNV